MQTITNMAMMELLLTMCLISWTLLTLWRIGQKSTSMKRELIYSQYVMHNISEEYTEAAITRMSDELTVRLNRLSENTIVHWEKELAEKEAQLVLREAALLEKCEETVTSMPLSQL